MKTMDDWQDDMSNLYEMVMNDAVELKKASELANVAGKALKAEQLKLAREIFAADRGDKPKLTRAA